MDAGALIYSILSASPDMQTLTGGRIYPMRLPQGTAVPAVAYQLVSRMPNEMTHGQRIYDHARIQVSIFANTYAEMSAVGDACRAAIDGYRSADIIAAVMDLELDHFEDLYDRYHRTQDYRLNLPSPI